jgi:hypothetical protein
VKVADVKKLGAGMPDPHSDNRVFWRVSYNQSDVERLETYEDIPEEWIIGGPKKAARCYMCGGFSLSDKYWDEWLSLPTAGYLLYLVENLEDFENTRFRPMACKKCESGFLTAWGPEGFRGLVFNGNFFRWYKPEPGDLIGDN